jgi:two-component system, NtrC family, response regulator AtoC
MNILLILPRGGTKPLENAFGQARVVATSSLSDGLALASRESWAAVVLSLSLDGVSPELAGRIAALPGVETLLLSHPHPTLQRTMEAEGAGAAALLREPLDAGAVLGELVQGAPEGAGLLLPRDEPEGAQLVGSSPAMAALFRTLARVAPTPATVLVQGESGTGKELVARALHDGSPRRSNPFVAVNCAAIPEHLLEAELFGHEKGAFTGAVGRSEGRFGRADGGTLFLDEIGDMGLVLQAKILRALEEGEIERVGGQESVPVDVRIVAATNRPLQEMVDEGEFRADLFFRLAVVQLVLPPLRERPEDLQELALHFAARFARRYGRPVRRLGQDAMERLHAHPWPGNVRELRNVMDRAVLLSRGGTLGAADLEPGGLGAPEEGGGSGGSAGALPGAPSGGDPTRPPVDAPLREVEAWHIARVLERTGGHMGETAQILGIHRNTLTNKVREYGLEEHRG